LLNGYQFVRSPYFENTALLVFEAMILKHFIVDVCTMFSISVHKTCHCSFIWGSPISHKPISEFCYEIGNFRTTAQIRRCTYSYIFTN